MSSSAYAKLPPAVRLDDVKDVIGILMGCQKRQMPLGGSYGWTVKVEGIHVKQIKSLPECVHLIIPKRLVLLYHFEGGDEGQRLVSGDSTPTNAAVMMGLLRFFGGEVELEQGEETNTPDGSWVEKVDPIHTFREREDGEYAAFQQRMWDLQPLTEDDFRHATQFARYTDE